MTLPIRFFAAAALCLLSTACGTAVQPVAPAPGPSAQERLAAVQAAAGVDDTELNVQPLRDPQVEDLREKATRALAGGDTGAAADALNQGPAAGA